MGPRLGILRVGQLVNLVMVRLLVVVVVVVNGCGGGDGDGGVLTNMDAMWW